MTCFKIKIGANLFQSAEDLTCLPIVALHQDFVVMSTLGLSDSERNVDGEWFLYINDGIVDISSLNSVNGLGVAVEPEWASMTPLETWLANFN